MSKFTRFAETAQSVGYILTAIYAGYQVRTAWKEIRKNIEDKARNDERQKLENQSKK